MNKYTVLDVRNAIRYSIDYLHSAQTSEHNTTSYEIIQQLTKVLNENLKKEIPDRKPSIVEKIIKAYYIELVGIDNETLNGYRHIKGSLADLAKDIRSDAEKMLADDDIMAQSAGRFFKKLIDILEEEEK